MSKDNKVIQLPKKEDRDKKKQEAEKKKRLKEILDYASKVIKW